MQQKAAYIWTFKYSPTSLVQTILPNAIASGTDLLLAH